MASTIPDGSSWIRELIVDFVSSPENTLKNPENDPAWAEPIIGFSSGGDSLYKFYKEDIGGFYLTPLEFFANEYPNTNATADELTIISWILPQTEATKTDHRKEKYFPCERWARSRIYGEEYNDKLRAHIVQELKQARIQAVAPALSPLFKSEKSKTYGFASTWSERHAAYASGLGTFGLSDGLITPVGKAMRCGSIIARIAIPPTPRPYNNHHAYCLFYTNGTCGKCIERCPIGAITKEGHNKELCSKYVNMTRQYVERLYKFNGYGCGLCQTSVPCESGIPAGLQITAH